MAFSLRAPLVVGATLLAVALFVTLLEHLLPSRETPPADDATRPAREAPRPELREGGDSTLVLALDGHETRITLESQESRRKLRECLDAAIASELARDAPPPPAAPGGRSLWGPEWRAQRRLDALLRGCLDAQLGPPPVPPPLPAREAER